MYQLSVLELQSQDYVFQITSLDLTAGWAKRFELDGFYRIRDKSLVVENHYGEKVHIAFPTGFSAPSKAGFVTFRDAIFGREK